METSSTQLEKAEKELSHVMRKLQTRFSKDPEEDCASRDLNTLSVQSSAWLKEKALLEMKLFTYSAKVVIQL